MHVPHAGRLPFVLFIVLLIRWARACFLFIIDSAALLLFRILTGLGLTCDVSPELCMFGRLRFTNLFLLAGLSRAAKPSQSDLITFMGGTPTGEKISVPWGTLTALANDTHVLVTLERSELVGDGWSACGFGTTMTDADMVVSRLHMQPTHWR